MASFLLKIGGDQRNYFAGFFGIVGPKDRGATEQTERVQHRGTIERFFGRNVKTFVDRGFSRNAKKERATGDAKNIQMTEQLPVVRMGLCKAETRIDDHIGDARQTTVFDPTDKEIEHLTNHVIVLRFA